MSQRIHTPTLEMNAPPPSSDGYWSTVSIARCAQSTDLDLMFPVIHDNLTFHDGYTRVLLGYAKCRRISLPVLVSKIHFWYVFRKVFWNTRVVIVVEFQSISSTLGGTLAEARIDWIPWVNQPEFVEVFVWIETTQMWRVSGNSTIVSTRSETREVN